MIEKYSQSFNQLFAWRNKKSQNIDVFSELSESRVKRSIASKTPIHKPACLFSRRRRVGSDSQSYIICFCDYIEPLCLRGWFS